MSGQWRVADRGGVPGAAAARPDAERSPAIIEAFAGGINARISEVLADPAQLPIEFQLTGSRPGSWTPQVVISRMAGFIMTRNARTEVQRARLARSAGSRLLPTARPALPTARCRLPAACCL